MFIIKVISHRDEVVFEGHPPVPTPPTPFPCVFRTTDVAACAHGPHARRESEGVDPFFSQKMLGVTSALSSMEALAKRLLATDVSDLISLSLSLALPLCLIGTTAPIERRAALLVFPELGRSPFAGAVARP